MVIIFHEGVVYRGSGATIIGNSKLAREFDISNDDEVLPRDCAGKSIEPIDEDALSDN